MGKNMKGLPCSFLDGVSCCYRKSVRPSLMERCWNCRHFERYKREMFEADERVMDEIDEERRTGVFK